MVLRRDAAERCLDRAEPAQAHHGVRDAGTSPQKPPSGTPSSSGWGTVPDRSDP
jgi:hypothetical protein